MICASGSPARAARHRPQDQSSGDHDRCPHVVRVSMMTLVDLITALAVLPTSRPRSRTASEDISDDGTDHTQLDLGHHLVDHQAGDDAGQVVARRTATGVLVQRRQVT